MYDPRVENSHHRLWSVRHEIGSINEQPKSVLFCVHVNQLPVLLCSARIRSMTDRMKTLADTRTVPVHLQLYVTFSIASIDWPISDRHHFQSPRDRSFCFAPETSGPVLTSMTMKSHVKTCLRLCECHVRQPENLFPTGIRTFHFDLN